MSKLRNRRLRGMPQTAKYRFSVERRWLKMPDGVRLAATIYMPRAKRDGETFPVLLEILPYRKDDTFYIVDYPAYSYFAENGIMTVKVDVRGTGGSEGVIPPREYSDIELNDAEEVIAQLAALPESNANVAMWGISWSGFNSLMVAMRRPPALKTIIAMHASDDLFHDDVHYIDGNLHLDSYHLFINHELGLPQTPNYRTDKAYFKNRFERKPWLFKYMKQQRDSEFWRSKSLRENYGAIKIPVYLVGGLLDGYRSAMMRIAENLDVPMKVEMGPWDHACPDDGTPGPNFEWMHEAVRWLKHWLCGERNGVDKECGNGKEFAVFVRNGHSTDAQMKTAPGQFRRISWPMKSKQDKALFLTVGARLTKRKGVRGSELLKYRPASGVSAGGWWGDTTGDMSRDDAHSRVFDSEPLEEPVEIIGFPKVRVRASFSAKVAHVVARLEDVAPDGTVALVAAAVLNTSQRHSRLKPSYMVPGRRYRFESELHFTTWTFRPGHRIRLAVSLAQFPMVWPSAEAMTAKVSLGCPESVLVLPVTSPEDGKRMRLPKVVKKLECPDGETIVLPDGIPDPLRTWTFNEGTGETTYTSQTRNAYRIKKRRFDLSEKNIYTTFDKQPANSSYVGSSSTTITYAKKVLRLVTVITVRSDEQYFRVSLSRKLFRGSRLIRERLWKETIKRDFH